MKIARKVLAFIGGSLIGLAVFIVLLGVIYMVDASEHPPVVESLSEQAVCLQTVASIWHLHYEDHRIAALDQLLRGNKVTFPWEGEICDLDHTGTAFSIVPIGHKSPHEFHVYVVLPKGKYLPKRWKVGQRLQVTGVIQSVSVLGIILQANIIVEE